MLELMSHSEPPFHINSRDTSRHVRPEHMVPVQVGTNVFVITDALHE
jgi:hypothetical protein